MGLSHYSPSREGHSNWSATKYELRKGKQKWNLLVHCSQQDTSTRMNEKTHRHSWLVQGNSALWAEKAALGPRQWQTPWVLICIERSLWTREDWGREILGGPIHTWRGHWCFSEGLHSTQRQTNEHSVMHRQTNLNSIPKALNITLMCSRDLDP